MNKAPIFILWDASFLWGLLALRGLRQLNLDCQLVSSQDISQGALAGKQAQNGLLVVPGGSARQKYTSLGKAGRKAILEWLSAGGNYLGFCGGAGLGLSGSDGLGICPLKREPYPSRFFHLLSGHMLAMTEAGQKALPVWWPGKFEDRACPGIRRIATISAPAEDLYIADIPLKLVPENLVRKLENNAGSSGPLFPAGQPLAISGKFGKGSYILSYTHLETPESAEANQLLATLLQDFGASCASAIPAWFTWRAEQEATKESVLRLSAFSASIRKVLKGMRDFCELGEKLDFFYSRNSWLCGWRPGFPGMGINNLTSCLACLAELPEDAPTPPSWKNTGALFNSLTTKFLDKAPALLWQLKLEKVLRNLPDQTIIDEKCQNPADIFGRPMPGGGLVEEIASLCSQYVYESQDRLFHP